MQEEASPPYLQCLLQRPAANLASLEASGSSTDKAGRPPPWPPRPRLLPRPRPLEPLPPCCLSPAHMAATKSPSTQSCWTEAMLPPLFVLCSAHNLSACLASSFGSLWSTLTSRTLISLGRRCRKMQANRFCLLLPPWASLQHGRHHLRGLPVAQRRHEKEFSAFWKSES
jgi:hypothetical protein